MIRLNSAKCLLCGDVLESRSRHDFKMCKCGALGVDGGYDYIRRVFKNQADFEELSIEEPEISEREERDNEIRESREFNSRS